MYRHLFPPVNDKPLESERKQETMETTTPVLDEKAIMARGAKLEADRVASIIGTADALQDNQLFRSFVADPTKNVNDYTEHYRANRPQVTGLKEGVADTGNHAEVKKQFRNMGEQLIAIANYSRGILDDRLLHTRASQGLNTQVGADGGFLLQSEFAQGIFQRQQEYGLFKNKCASITLGDGKVEFVEHFLDNFDKKNKQFGGVAVQWMEEGNASAPSRPALKRMTTRAFKLGGHYYATEEQLQDATALSTIANDQFGKAMAFTIDEAILRGDGVAKPAGILNCGALVSVAKDASQVAGTISVANIQNMYARLYRAGGINEGTVWVINQELVAQLPSLIVGTFPVYLPPSGLAQAPNGTLLGLPIIVSDMAEAPGTKGDIMLLNLSQYRVVDKTFIQYAESMHVEFLSDQRVFKFRTYAGGQSLWEKAVTPYKGTNLLSPFVTLDARA
jgi:HK97 family phage major capsid protein